MAETHSGRTIGSDDAPAISRRRFPFLPANGPRALADRAASVWLHLAAAFEREIDAGRGFLWLPVAFGFGILVYFGLPAEPWMPALATLAAVLAVTAWRARYRVVAFRVLVVAAMVAAGALAAKLRTDAAAAPVLAREATVTVSGWITEREEAARGGVRVLLRVHEISGLAAAATPRFVRVTVRSKADGLAVGDAISMRARLQPPGGAVMPGGYDFARVAFYEGIGGVGFAYGAAQPADIGAASLAIRLSTPLAHLRDTIRRRIEAALPGDPGHVAAALVMGDRGGISDATEENMRASGLAHMLAISGLHMVLVAGSAFWLLRALLALSPGLALTRPIKKWAAAGALAVAAFYLGISGAGIATQRAFVMLAIMLVAVMLDRPAITLRNVALAALVILVLTPESLTTASFQMSFAATVALVAGYEAITAWRDRRMVLVDAGGGAWTWFTRSAGGLFLTSLIAGLATAPYAAFHFQRMAPLTLVANLAAMPLVGTVVMPMAFLSVVLMPFGLEALPLTAMGWGLDWVMLVAASTAAWSEGYGGIAAMPVLAIGLATAGFLWLALWRERWRFAGLAPVLLAVPIALATPRPDILIEEGGATVAVRGDDGRFAIVNGKGESFVVESWLRADADPRKADATDLTASVACDPLGCIAPFGSDSARVAVSNSIGSLEEDCRMAAIVIARFAVPKNCAAARVIGRQELARHGAHALYRDGEDGEGRPAFWARTAYPDVRRPFMPPRRDQ